jgi:hypothetical protein
MQETMLSKKGRKETNSTWLLKESLLPKNNPKKCLNLIKETILVKLLLYETLLGKLVSSASRPPELFASTEILSRECSGPLRRFLSAMKKNISNILENDLNFLIISYTWIY